MTQFMFKSETTPGLTVTPTLTLPILDGESLDIASPIMESEALWAGALVKRMEATNGGLKEVGGSTPFELSTKGATTLFKHMFGAVNTSGSGTFTHVFTPASLMGLAATLQVGVNMDGTTVPKTLSGAKVESWEVSGAEGEFLMLGIDWIAQRGQIGSRTVTDGVTTDTSTTLASAAADFTEADVDKDVSGTGIPAGAYITAVKADGSEATMSVAATATGSSLSVVIGKALATASNPSGIAYYKMHHAILKIDGSAVPMKGFTLNGENALIRDYAGGSRNSLEIKPDGDTERTLGGKIDLAYATNAQVNRYLAGAPFTVEILATHGTDSVKFEGYGRYDTSPVPMAGRSRVITEHPMRFFANTTDASALQCTVVNTDASAA
jgi:hypothetical protein